MKTKTESQMTAFPRYPETEAEEAARTAQTPAAAVTPDTGDISLYALTDAGYWKRLCRQEQAKIVSQTARIDELRAVLIQAVEHEHELIGVTDWRVAEHGEPRWVCNARAVLAKGKDGASA